MIGYITKPTFVGLTAYLVEAGGRWSFQYSNASLFTYSYFLEINTEGKYSFIDKTDSIKYHPFKDESHV